MTRSLKFIIAAAAVAGLGGCAVYPDSAVYADPNYGTASTTYINNGVYDGYGYGTPGAVVAQPYVVQPAPVYIYGGGSVYRGGGGYPRAYGGRPYYGPGPVYGGRPYYGGRPEGRPPGYGGRPPNQVRPPQAQPPGQVAPPPQVRPPGQGRPPGSGQGRPPRGDGKQYIQGNGNPDRN